MNYREAATFLFGLRRFRMKPGTDSTERLLSRLGDPHQGGTFSRSPDRTERDRRRG